MSQPSPEPKLVVDEDWKAQVQREKEELKRQATEAESHQAHEFPPASLQLLVTTYATQALVSMGYIPDPVSRETSVNKPLAKHFIDMLSVLEEKTKGNLDDQESTLLTDTLHQLRMAFLASPPPAPMDGPAKPKSTIELP